jgi:hypothetical protein
MRMKAREKLRLRIRDCNDEGVIEKEKEMG